MPRFLLDADTVSFALRGQGRVASRLVQHVPSEVCVSAITLAELAFGVETKNSARLRRAVRAFLADVAVVPFGEAAAERFGVVAAAFARAGTPIGTLDTLLAAQALSLGLTVVTNNTRHFGRVPGLKVENGL